MTKLHGGLAQKRPLFDIGLHCEGLKLEVPEMSNTSCGVSNQKQNVSNKCTKTDIAYRTSIVHDSSAFTSLHVASGFFRCCRFFGSEQVRY